MTKLSKLDALERKLKLKLVGAALAIICVTSCDTTDGYMPDEIMLGDEIVDLNRRDTIFGEGGGISFGDDPKMPERGAGIGVNAFLWRASLDILSSWPISSADPFGGVIITDWFAPPDAPNEKFKLNVFILDRALRADAVRVSVFRQTRNQNETWGPATVKPLTQTKIENAILTKARQIRSASLK